MKLILTPLVGVLKNERLFLGSSLQGCECFGLEWNALFMEIAKYGCVDMRVNLYE